MDLKQWQCRNKHTLGMIFSDEDHIPRLMLYSRAVDLGADKPEDVQILGPLSGSMPVTCTECGDVQNWNPHMKVLARIIVNLRKEERKLLQAYLLEGRVKKVTRKKNRAKI
jgi:hypothetical protein